MRWTDKERLDYLEMLSKVSGGLLLHNETSPTGRTGLGMRFPNGERRSLRKAIDEAAGQAEEATNSQPSQDNGS
jgi:hypothetical protein